MLCTLACFELGVIYIPMKHDYPEDRIKQIKEDSAFELLISEEIFKNEVLNFTAIEVPVQKVLPSDIAYILFTSGSTGRPKGAQISRAAYENFFSWASEYFDHLTPEDKWLQISEFTFDISLVDVALFLSKGVSLYFSQFNGNIFQLAHEVESHCITSTSTVPNNLNMLLDDMIVERANLSSLHTTLIAGSRFSWGLYEKCQKHLADKNVYNLYGPTEFTIYSHAKKLTMDPGLDSVDHNISIGTPVLNTNSIISENELLLSGPQLMSGYVNDKEKTSKALSQFDGKAFYKSGDVAFQNERGEYFITGRNDDTIKTRGYRVNLLDVDSYILRLEYVKDTCSVAIAHPQHENAIVNFIILKNEKSDKEIKNDLKEILLSYQIPEKFIFLDSFPVNNSGKVCKKQLKEMI